MAGVCMVEARVCAVHGGAVWLEHRVEQGTLLGGNWEDAGSLVNDLGHER